MPANFAAIGLFAADHGMRINVGSFARFDMRRVGVATRTREQALVAGQLDPASLYVLRAPGETAYRAGPDDAIGTVDGFRVLAPGWLAFDDCCSDAMPPLERAAAATAAQ